jgi:hypothetical protein
MQQQARQHGRAIDVRWAVLRVQVRDGPRDGKLEGEQSEGKDRGNGMQAGFHCRAVYLSKYHLPFPKRSHRRHRARPGT